MALVAEEHRKKALSKVRYRTTKNLRSSILTCRSFSSGLNYVHNYYIIHRDLGPLRLIRGLMPQPELAKMSTYANLKSKRPLSILLLGLWKAGTQLIRRHWNCISACKITTKKLLMLLQSGVANHCKLLLWKSTKMHVQPLLFLNLSMTLLFLQKMKLMICNHGAQSEAVINLLREMPAIKVSQDENVCMYVCFQKITGTYKNVNLCQAEVEEAIEHTIARIVESRHATDSAALELHKCLQDNYEKAVNVASVGCILSGVANHCKLLLWKSTKMHVQPLVSQSFYDLAILTEDEADDLQLFVFNHGAQSEVEIDEWSEISGLCHGWKDTLLFC